RKNGKEREYKWRHLVTPFAGNHRRQPFSGSRKYNKKQDISSSWPRSTSGISTASIASGTCIDPEQMTLSPNVDDPSRPAAIEKRNLGRMLWIGAFSICLILIIVAYAFTRPLEDFVEYWGAGHLLVTGGNPYSLNEMYRIERPLGWSQPVP